ncbi:hypothetical protein KIN20_006940 [Parelaphostrongylus tenuis]|uniref:Uncharacterized protein n=1 Tax=Parelaphostrongylus tenuis TaxID=148309 RepID=A0AAD5M5P7_PARTN|nr:hypothetical protein KIN20_006940 [Parelaphostrongylus tenuis]
MPTLGDTKKLTSAEEKKNKKGKKEESEPANKKGKKDEAEGACKQQSVKGKVDAKAQGKNENQPQVPQVAQCAKGGAQVVAQWLQRALDMGVDALRTEYRGLAKYTLPEMTIDACKANQEAGRNRYQDVPCQDQRRVVIKWPGAVTDYIHANYVGTPVSDKRFICTQGKNKCAPYWPERVGETKSFSGIDITNIQVGSIDSFQPKSTLNFTITMRAMSPDEPTICLSVLSIKFPKPDGTSEAREVRHYQWLDWPDRGVPPCRLTSMELLSRIRGTKKPIIVHCSAGIGRTGTIVAIEYILERMQAGVECATMCDLLKELRNQRAWSIQNDLTIVNTRMNWLSVEEVKLSTTWIDRIPEVKAYYRSSSHLPYIIACDKKYEYILTEDNKAKYTKFVQDYNAATGTQ